MRPSPESLKQIAPSPICQKATEFPLRIATSSVQAKSLKRAPSSLDLTRSSSLIIVNVDSAKERLHTSSAGAQLASRTTTSHARRDPSSERSADPAPSETTHIRTPESRK